MGSSPNLQPMEKIIFDFCKHILPVPRSCASVAVLGELGRLPFHIGAHLHSVKFYNHTTSWNCNRLVLDTFKLPKSLGHQSCCQQMFYNITSNGFGHAVANPSMLSMSCI